MLIFDNPYLYRYALLHISNILRIPRIPRIPRDLPSQTLKTFATIHPADLSASIFDNQFSVVSLPSVAIEKVLFFKKRKIHSNNAVTAYSIRISTFRSLAEHDRNAPEHVSAQIRPKPLLGNRLHRQTKPQRSTWPPLNLATFRGFTYDCC